MIPPNNRYPNPPDPPPPPPQEDLMVVPTNRTLFGLKRPSKPEEQEVHQPMEIDSIGALVSKYTPNPNPNTTDFS